MSSGGKGFFSIGSVAQATPFDNQSNGFTSVNVQKAIEETTTKNVVTEVSATSSTTTTSTSNVLLNSMTLTPTAGSYFVTFSTTVDHSAQNRPIEMSIYVGGSQQSASVRSVITRVNSIGAISLTACVTTQGVVTVNGSQAIEIRWSTTSGTATAYQRTMSILRLS